MIRVSFRGLLLVVLLTHLASCLHANRLKRADGILLEDSRGNRLMVVRGGYVYHLSPHLRLDACDGPTLRVYFRSARLKPPTYGRNEVIFFGPPNRYIAVQGRGKCSPASAMPIDLSLTRLADDSISIVVSNRSTAAFIARSRHGDGLRLLVTRPPGFSADNASRLRFLERHGVMSEVFLFAPEWCSESREAGSRSSQCIDQTLPYRVISHNGAVSGQRGLIVPAGEHAEFIVDNVPAGDEVFALAVTADSMAVSNALTNDEPKPDIDD